MNRNRPQLVAPRSADTMLEMARNTGGNFDIDAYHAMQGRDDQLVQEEILHGAQSSKFIYRFKIMGTEVSGVSVVGARHLAAAYGGLKHRIVASALKVNSLFTFTSYPFEGMPMMVQANRIMELANEPDGYNVVVEIADLKVGNTIQVECFESRWGTRDDGSLFERPNYMKIAQAKGYRNAVLALMPQDVLLKWKTEMMRLGRDEVITDSVIDQKRAGILTYCATAGIPVNRESIDSLTMAQITGLAEAARTKDKVRVEQALAGLGVLQERVDDETGEISPGAATPPAKTRRSRSATPSTGATGGDPRPEPPLEGEPIGATGPTGAGGPESPENTGPASTSGPPDAAPRRGRMFSRDSGGSL